MDQYVNKASWIQQFEIHHAPNFNRGIWTDNVLLSTLEASRKKIGYNIGKLCRKKVNGIGVTGHSVKRTMQLLSENEYFVNDS